MARHAESTQNNKYAVSLQYLKKELRYEVVVLHADKHESLLQGNIIFNGFGQACPNFLGKCLCDILRKKSRVKLEN